jgi:hypothetical protein
MNISGCQPVIRRAIISLWKNICFQKYYLPDGLGGANEPGAPFGGKTSKVRLDDSTIEANARFFK